MPDVFGNPTLQEMTAQRQRAFQGQVGDIMQSDMARASTGAEKAGTGLGSFLGALGVKYLGKPYAETAEGQNIAAREEAVQASQTVPTNPEGANSPIQMQQAKLEQLRKFNSTQWASQDSIKAESAQTEKLMSMVKEQKATALEEEGRAALSSLAVNPDDEVATQVALTAGVKPEAIDKVKQFGVTESSKFGKMANDLGFKRGTPEYAAKVQELIALYGDTSTKVINELGGVPNPFAKKLGETLGTNLATEADKMQQTVGSLGALNESALLLNNNDVISGIAGNFELGLSKVLSEAGLIGSDDVDATEAFFANQGRQVAEVIKAFGAGTGLSDADREYAQKIAGGEIKLSEGALRKLIGLGQKYSAEGLAKYNNKAQKVIDKNPEFEGILPVYDIPEPVSVQPLDPAMMPTDPSMIAVDSKNPNRKLYNINGFWQDAYGNKIK